MDTLKKPVGLPSYWFPLGYIYNRLPVLQISMFRSSSQDLVAASGQRRPAKPSGALCITQSTTTCCTDCVMCPQAHVADSWTPHSFNVSPTRAVPQRRRCSFIHCLRWRSAPGGSTDMSRLPPGADLHVRLILSKAVPSRPYTIG